MKKVIIFATAISNRLRFTGEMAEWSIAAVLKTVDCNRSGGSNPSFSAKKNRNFRFGFLFSKSAKSLLLRNFGNKIKQCKQNKIPYFFTKNRNFRFGFFFFGNFRPQPLKNNSKTLVNNTLTS